MLFRFVLLGLVPLILVACVGVGTQVSTQNATPTSIAIRPTATSQGAASPVGISRPTVRPSETPGAPTRSISFTASSTVTPTSSAPLSFRPITYRDQATGFEFDYPSTWALAGQVSGGDRGAVVQLSSGGKPKLDITVLRWDPSNNLPAFVENRKQAWKASGISIISAEQFVLPRDSSAVSIVIQTREGERAWFFFTAINNRYLQLSGNDDLALLAEIGRTVRLMAR